MRGAANVSGIKMNKSLRSKKALKVWLEAKKKKGIKRREEIEEAKKNWPRIWRKLKF